MLIRKIMILVLAAVLLAGCIGAASAEEENGSGENLILGEPTLNTEPTEGYVAGCQITFTFSATGAKTYNITYGDGDTEKTVDSGVSHTYEAAGTYTVRVKAINGTKSLSTTKTIVVNAPADKEETAPTDLKLQTSPLSGFTVGSPITFIFSATGAKSYNITYFDGDTEKTVDSGVSHTYEVAGTYTVTVKAINGTKSLSTTNTIVVVAHTDEGDTAPTNLALTYTPTSGITTETEVAFTFSAIGAKSYNITYGDGGSEVGVISGIKHTYNSEGTHMVTLTAVNGTATTTKTCNVSVGSVQSLTKVAVTVDAPQYDHTPNTYSDVTVVTTGVTCDKIEWTPSVTKFAENKIYNVTITLKTKTGYDFKTGLTGTINGHAADVTRKSDDEAIISYKFPATSSKVLPTISLSATPTTGNTPLTVSITYSITNGNTNSYMISYGESDQTQLLSSSSGKLTHNYENAGTYVINLSATNSNGTAYKTVTIKTTKAVLKAIISATNPTGNTPLDVKFTDASTGAVTSRLWNFGDGTTSTLEGPVHTFTTIGEYTVTLKVSDGKSEDIASKKITVTAANANIKSAATTAAPSGNFSINLNGTDIPSPLDMIKEFVKLFFSMLEPGNYIIFGNNTTTAAAK